MFGIGGWEFVFIAVLALLLFGPDKLPQFARTLGRFMRDFKRYQAMAESTIRAEVFATDPSPRKDQFETGKEFSKKVAGGGFSRPDREAAATAPEKEPEPVAEGDAASDATDAADAAEASAKDGEGERDEA